MMIRKHKTQSMRWRIRQVPRLVIAGRFPLDVSDFTVRYRSDTHALHLHEYPGVVRIGTRELILQPGTITWSPAHLSSSYHLPSPGHHWCVHFLADRSRAGNAVDVPIAFQSGGAQAFVTERLAKVSAWFVQGKSGDDVAAMRAATTFQDLLLWLSEQSGTAPATAKSTAAVDQAVGIIQSRLREPLCVEQLADELELTQNYLARRFKQRYGTTIQQFLLLRRVDHARHLLTNTDMPIHRVAQHVGMPDAQHFNKQFRRVMGISPSTYRQTPHPTPAP